MKARFDSLDPLRGGRSFRFASLLGEVVARVPDEVVPALERIERAAGEGRYAAGFVSYEAAAGLDPALRTHPPAGPLLHFGIFAERHEVEPLDGLEEADSAATIGPLRPHLDAAAYRERVERIQDWIAAGDTYQVNFTFPLETTHAGSAASLYHRLALAQRSAYCALLETAEMAIVSTSPELFFRSAGRDIELRPMKGTRPRGRWVEEDEALARELQYSPKDRAENLMIVDLLRSDLGRIAETGSIAVPRLFELERYPTVHQMTSAITGRLREGCGLTEIFRALFPSGSVTGAPKVRTSQIIREVEEMARGPYTGAVGFVGPEEAVFSVAIRTAVLEPRGQRLTLGIGSGITAGSSPTAEYRECLDKAAFLNVSAADFQLVETLRLEVPGGYRARGSHLDRLAASARFFGFPFPARRLSDALRDAAKGPRVGSYKVRLLLARDGTVETGVEPLPSTEPPVRLAVATIRVDPSDPFLYQKTTRRDLYEAARSEHASADDVILVNREGRLTETTRANLVLEIEGSLLTPPISSGLLPGVRRAQALRSGEIRERELTLEDLNRATGIYLLSSVRGWRRGILPPLHLRRAFG